MNFSVTSKNLSIGLQRVINAITNKPVIPIYNNILLEAINNTLIIVATDGEVRIQTKIAAITLEPGKITVQAKKFDDIVKSLAMGDVCFKTNAEKPQEIIMACNKIKYILYGLSADEYPETIDFQEDWFITMPSHDLISSLSKVAYAHCEDENRKALNGILFSIRSGLLTIAATDGRRLALVETALHDGAENIPDNDIILPYKAVDELRKSLDKQEKVKIRFMSSAALFETKDTSIMTKLKDETYPNYRQVIPESFTQKVAIPREIFSSVLNRVSKVISGDSGSVTFDITASKMEVSAKSMEYGEASEPIEVSLEGENIKIAFNPDYFLDPLKTLECDQLFLEFNDSLSPCALSGDEGFLYILMPMNLNKKN